MTPPLKTFIFALTSKTSSVLNKRHELEQLLGMHAETATLSSTKPAPCQGSEMTSPHTVSKVNPLSLVGTKPPGSEVRVW